jgi:hypothetical protein
VKVVTSKNSSCAIILQAAVHPGALAAGTQQQNKNKHNNSLLKTAFKKLPLEASWIGQIF